MIYIIILILFILLFIYNYENFTECKILNCIQSTHVKVGNKCCPIINNASTYDNDCKVLECQNNYYSNKEKTMCCYYISSNCL